MDFKSGHFPAPNFSNYAHVVQDAEESGLPDSEDNNPEENNETCTEDAKESEGNEQNIENRIYLDLIPVRSFLHTSGGGKVSPAKETSTHFPVPVEDQKDSLYQEVHKRNILSLRKLMSYNLIVVYAMCNNYKLKETS